MAIPVGYAVFALTFSTYAAIKLMRHLIAWSFQTPQTPPQVTGVMGHTKTSGLPVTAAITRPQQVVTQSSQKNLS